MLKLPTGTVRDCDCVTRRQFLQVGGLSALGLTLPDLLRIRAANSPYRRDVNCILLWMQGGPSHIDTFDPKPDAPQEIRGEFNVIATRLPGVTITEHLPRLAAQLDHRVDPAQAIRLLKQRLAAIPNVTTEPTADVEILTFTPMGPVLAVRLYCNNTHYWQVYFDTNRVIRETFGEAGFPAPEQHFAVRSGARNGGA